ncbi:MAG TPA: heat-inducible transcriptional repressor HrcA [Acidobacteriota bacterium]|nr:heat-inducible transcriptional repressor HrcA [Acidobacteriota bacterium]HRV07468.1 heat-inducible transcriptional repressor HrcA [Acidobacteriota bacterium]
MMPDEPAVTIDNRARAVLRGLIREYVCCGQPVGSRRLAKVYPEKLSPATLRNVMADLEEAGFLEQPHVSAGRVPTPAGYRYYVNSLMRRRQLSQEELGTIRQALEQERDPEALMDRTSRLLASQTNSIGIVLAPSLSKSVLWHIEFLRLARDRLLVILVSQSGLVQHRLVTVPETPPQAELDEASRYLIEHFRGLTLLEIRTRLQQMMRQDQTTYDRLLRNVVLLGTTTLPDELLEKEDPTQIYVDGASRVAQRLDDPDIYRLASILQTLEEKRRILEILSYCLQSEGKEPFVTIGLEKCVPEMNQWTVIVARFQSEQGNQGAVGVLGPARMEYDRTISLVDYVAQTVNSLMGRN